MNQGEEDEKGGRERKGKGEGKGRKGRERDIASVNGRYGRRERG